MNKLRDPEIETIPLISKSDSPPSPPPVVDTRKDWEKRLAVCLILASTVCERTAYFSIAANLVLSLLSNTSLKWQYTNTMLAAAIYTGTSYISTLIFAIISDVKLGRAKTILIGYILYFIGYTSAILITNPHTHSMMCYPGGRTHLIPPTSLIHERCAKAILPTLIVIAMGAGAVQTNMAVLGAEQVSTSKITSRYFDKYIIAVNTASILARMVIPTIEKDETYFYIAYTVAASMLCLSALLFILGWRYYIRIKPCDSVVIHCIPVVINAFQSWRRYRKMKRLADKEKRNSRTANLSDTSQSLNEIDTPPPSTFLDFAKEMNHGKFTDRVVEDVKLIRNAFIVFGFFIPFWLVDNQIYSSFTLQGHQMNTMGEPRMVTWMVLAAPITIIIGVIILNMFVYKCVDARNRAGSVITKFLVGMGFACVAMWTAGGIEIIRQYKCNSAKDSSSLPIYAQLPQNIGIGLSELFAIVASYEYAFFAAPRSAQSVFVSLRFCSIGIASFIGILYTSIFSRTMMKLDFSCVSMSPTPWRLFIYFYILAGIQLTFMIIFLACQQKFQIIKLNPQQMGTNPSSRRSSRSSTYRFYF